MALPARAGVHQEYAGVRAPWNGLGGVSGLCVGSRLVSQCLTRSLVGKVFDISVAFTALFFLIVVVRGRLFAVRTKGEAEERADKG